MHSRSETTNATRYVLINGEMSNETLFFPSTIVVEDSGIFDSAFKFGFKSNVIENVAFIEGSSKHGKDLLASIGSNC